MDQNLENFFRDKFKQAEGDRGSTWNLPPAHSLDAALHQITLEASRQKNTRRRWTWAVIVLLSIIAGQQFYFQQQLHEYQQRLKQLNAAQKEQVSASSSSRPTDTPSSLDEDKLPADLSRSPQKFTPRHKAALPPLTGPVASSESAIKEPLPPILPSHSSKSPSSALLDQIAFTLNRPTAHLKISSEVILPVEKKSTHPKIKSASWQVGTSLKTGLSRLTMQVPVPPATMSLTRYDRWAPQTGLAVTLGRQILPRISLQGTLSLSRHLNHSLLQDIYAFDPGQEMVDGHGKTYYLASATLATPLGDSPVNLTFPMAHGAAHSSLANETAIDQYLNILSMQAGLMYTADKGHWRWQAGVGSGVNRLLSTETVMDVTLKMDNQVMLEATEQPYLHQQTRHTFMSIYAEAGLAVDLSPALSWQTNVQFNQSLSSLRLRPQAQSPSTHLQELALKTGIFLKIK